MKAVIKLLLLIVLAVAVGVALQDTTGYISLVINDERRTVSLVVGVLFLVLLFFIAYLLVRIVSRLLNAPKNIETWREKRRTKRDLDLLERGWMGWLEGRVDIAEKDFNKLHSKTRSEQRQVLASLAAAKAALSKLEPRIQIGTLVPSAGNALTFAAALSLEKYF